MCRDHTQCLMTQHADTVTEQTYKRQMRKHCMTKVTVTQERIIYFPWRLNKYSLIMDQ